MRRRPIYRRYLHTVGEVWQTVLVILGVFILWVLLLLSPRACNAQDSRWRLIQGVDSIVAVPLQDLRTAAGYRVAKNITARQCAWELIERAKELSSARQTIEAKNAAIFKKDEAIAKLRESNDAIMDRARKAKRRNPVLWIGIGAGAMLLIQQQLK